MKTLLFILFGLLFWLPCQGQYYKDFDLFTFTPLSKMEKSQRKHSYPYIHYKKKGNYVYLKCHWSPHLVLTKTFEKVGTDYVEVNIMKEPRSTYYDYTYFRSDYYITYSYDKNKLYHITTTTKDSTKCIYFDYPAIATEGYIKGQVVDMSQTFEGTYSVYYYTYQKNSFIKKVIFYDPISVKKNPRIFPLYSVEECPIPQYSMFWDVYIQLCGQQPIVYYGKEEYDKVGR